MKEILTKALSLLIVLILSATSLYAQAPIKKPQKKTTTTTTSTTTKLQTSNNTNENKNSQADSNTNIKTTENIQSTNTVPTPQVSTNTNENKNSQADSNTNIKTIENIQTTTTANKLEENANTPTNNIPISSSINTQESSNTTTITSGARTGRINGHEWVDLGLSVKWATCNIGASRPSDYGNYYAWGETSTKSYYTQMNSRTYGKSKGSIAGNSQYDAARANWGSTWRLPTAGEIDELVDKCTIKWTTQRGHKGYKVTGPNGNSIFLPAAGLGGGVTFVAEHGYYWSATPYGDDADGAYSLDFGNDGFQRHWSLRIEGKSVRPVSE